MKQFASLVLGVALVVGQAQAAEPASSNALIASVQASTGLSVAAATTLVAVGTVAVAGLVYTAVKNDDGTVTVSTTTSTN
jgi:hypothetical protein